ncbi:MAG: metallophosphoesterase, partial [Candidatus Anstonellales archaeon]
MGVGKMGLRGQWKKQKTEQKTGQANKFINSNQIRENSQVEKNPFGNKKDGLKDGSNLYKGREQELCYIDFRACDLRKARGHSFGNAINQLRLYSEKPAKKIFLMGDLHIPYHDKKALLTALLYAVQEVKPDWLVILGDLLDFKGMSSYLKDIRERDLTKELIESAEILKTITELFAGVEKIIYIEGNHEERLYSYIYKNAPELSGIFKNPLSLFKTIQSELGHEIFNDKIKYHTPRESAQPYYPLVGRRLLAIHGHEYHKGSKYGVINVARNIL